MRRAWGEILKVAADIVCSYDTQVTLRQLFYRLIAAGIIKNTKSDYSTLSATTTKARRDGWFPPLSDRTRSIERPGGYDSPGQALRTLATYYQVDRTKGQEHQIWIAVEKRTFMAQLESWFGEDGFPIVALGGYSSEGLERTVLADVRTDGRPAILVYAGDHDPSGEDIDRNFVDQTRCWDDIVRVALTSDQVTEYNLPLAYGKATDTRARGFTERHGHLVQVELEALDPNDLRRLYWEAIEPYWEEEIYDATIKAEREERSVLLSMARDDPATTIRELRAEVDENEQTILELTAQIEALT